MRKKPKYDFSLEIKLNENDIMMENIKAKDKKMELLEKVPRYKLDILAKENSIPRTGNIKKLRERIAEKFDYKVIEEIYEEYEDAGNATIHLFKFDNIDLIALNQRNNLLSLLKRHNLEKFFELRQRIALSSTPQIVLIRYRNKEKNKIKIVLEFEGKEIITRRSDTREFLIFNPLIVITVIIHLYGLIEVRARNRNFAKKIIEIVAEYFNDGDFDFIRFNEDDIENIINWAKIFRNASIKPLEGEISSIRMTAKKDSDLRKVKLYKNREEFIGACLRTGVYLQFEYGKNNRKIGFQINPNQGKIFFKTMVGEQEIDFVLSKIREVKGI